MNKISIKSLLLFMACFMSALPLFAQTSKTFYVCSGTSFNLRAENVTGLTYKWYAAGSSTVLDSDTTLTQSVTLADPLVYEQKKFVLLVDSTNSCTSEGDTFTVFIMPQLTATIDAPTDVFCSNELPATGSLTATVNVTSFPPGVGVAYTWGDGPTTATRSITITGTGGTTFTVAPSYTLPATIGGEKLDDCEASASAADDITITPSAPPTVPDVTLE